MRTQAILGTLVLLTSFSAEPANPRAGSLAACGEAIKAHEPAITGKKHVVKTRSAPRGRHEYWINAEQADARIYCRASRREGVLQFAVDRGQWAGHYPRPEDQDFRLATQSGG